MNEKIYVVEDLLQLMSRLRDPKNGCPWDVKQSYGSIVSSTIEEAYEVADAIQNKDFDHLKEELGDLLFQVIFYCQLAKEDQLYNFDDVVHTLVSKLIRRHPHVFPDGTLEGVSNIEQLSDSEIRSNWEGIKKEERKSKGEAGLLADVPLALPAMTRALKLQKRAATVGFDWKDAIKVLDKVEEEVSELKEAIAAGVKEHIEEELGDAMFSLVNLSRHYRLDPEAALRKTNSKFIQRFEFIEQKLEEVGKSLGEVDLDIMEGYWQQAKGRE